MRVYKKITNFSLLVSIISFAISVSLEFFVSCFDTTFWVDVSLGIFSGAILTVLTSLVSYHYEKRKVLESFLYHTKIILKYLGKYQEGITLEQKLHFYLDYYELDKSAWDIDFGDMDFYFERINKKRKYIYDYIYKPILDFNLAVLNHVSHFRWHLDGNGKNDVVMQNFLLELQEYLLVKTEQDIPTEFNDQGEPIAFCHCTSVESKLVQNIEKELSGRYYKILCGKRTLVKHSKKRGGTHQQEEGCRAV